MKLERFHASSDKQSIVQYHPQANCEFSRSQGYIILKLEPWVVAEMPDFADSLAKAMNQMGIDPRTTATKMIDATLAERGLR